jgi:hypothetical protein
MSILTNKMPSLTENAKVLILSKLEGGWSIRRKRVPPNAGTKVDVRSGSEM